MDFHYGFEKVDFVTFLIKAKRISPMIVERRENDD